MRPPCQSGPLLVTRGVRKAMSWAGARWKCCANIDLTVERGEFLALRGASGAGKSTLLHLLGGLDLPNAGTLYLTDRTCARWRHRALARLRNRRVGFVFQAYHLLPELSALENVALPARMARLPSGDAMARGRDLLKRVGLGSAAGAPAV